MKPDNITTTDWLIKKTAEYLGEDEEMCHKIIFWSYKAAKDATYTNKSVEFPGFGKLLVSGPKIKRKIKYLERKIPFFKNIVDNPHSEESKNNYAKKLDGLYKLIEDLKTKLPDEVE